MPTILPANGSLLDTRSLARGDFHSLFDHADQLKRSELEYGNFYSPANRPDSKTIALLFFEPSTRTRVSFQIAAFKLGYRVVAIESSGSSLAKGESYSDTVLNVAAMRPDALVVRYDKSEELDALLPSLPMPVLNAGSGKLAHPTQGLLDAYTILKERGRLEGERVLIVGDLRHSRVARSNFDVLKKLGCEVAVCGPKHFLPEPPDVREYDLKVFDDLDAAVSWPTVYMGLRIQLERHDAETSAQLEKQKSEYHERFGLNRARLKRLGEDAIIMHPGPINHGVEFSNEVAGDPRNRVLKQVENGVLIRAALLARANFQETTNKRGTPVAR